MSRQNSREISNVNVTLNGSEIGIDRSGNNKPFSDVKVMLKCGSDGKGIQSITKTSSSGLIDTYTITYTDGTTSTFTVTNGADTKNYGYCNTAADVGTKQVQMLAEPFEAADLIDGAKIRILFANGNTASSPSLKIDDLTAASIITLNGTSSWGFSYYDNWVAGEWVEFIYSTSDGKWGMIPTQRMLYELGNAVAPIEKKDNVVQNSYEVGDYFRHWYQQTAPLPDGRDGDLMKVSLALSSGGSYAVGTQVEVTSVADELKRALKADRVEIPASNWSATTNASGLYTNTVNLGMKFNTYVETPCIYLTGSSKNTMPTAAQSAAYNLLSKVYFPDALKADTMTLGATVKPTETFYVLVKT